MGNFRYVGYNARLGKSLVEDVNGNIQAVETNYNKKLVVGEPLQVFGGIGNQKNTVLEDFPSEIIFAPPLLEPEPTFNSSVLSSLLTHFIIRNLPKSSILLAGGGAATIGIYEENNFNITVNFDEDGGFSIVGNTSISNPGLFTGFSISYNINLVINSEQQLQFDISVSSSYSGNFITDHNFDIQPINFTHQHETNFSGNYFVTSSVSGDVGLEQININYVTPQNFSGVIGVSPLDVETDFNIDYEDEFAFFPATWTSSTITYNASITFNTTASFLNNYYIQHLPDSYTNIPIKLFSSIFLQTNIRETPVSEFYNAFWSNSYWSPSNEDPTNFNPPLGGFDFDSRRTWWYFFEDRGDNIYFHFKVAETKFSEINPTNELEFSRMYEIKRVIVERGSSDIFLEDDYIDPDSIPILSDSWTSDWVSSYYDESNWLDFLSVTRGSFTTNPCLDSEFIASQFPYSEGDYQNFNGDNWEFLYTDSSQNIDEESPSLGRVVDYLNWNGTVPVIPDGSELELSVYGTITSNNDTQCNGGDGLILDFSDDNIVGTIIVYKSLLIEDLGLNLKTLFPTQFNFNLLKKISVYRN